MSAEKEKDEAEVSSADVGKVLAAFSQRFHELESDAECIFGAAKRATAAKDVRKRWTDRARAASPGFPRALVERVAAFACRRDSPLRRRTVRGRVPAARLALMAAADAALCCCEDASSAVETLRAELEHTRAELARTERELYAQQADNDRLTHDLLLLKASRNQQRPSGTQS